MYALAIIDELTPRDLTGGVVVAGTGVIDNNPAPSRLVNADALGEELKFYHGARGRSQCGPARHDISQRTPKVCSGSFASQTSRGG